MAMILKDKRARASLRCWHYHIHHNKNPCQGLLNVTTSTVDVVTFITPRRVFLWLGNQRIVEDDLSGLQTRHDGLLWRRLQSQAEAVHSAARLPVWQGSELVPGQCPDQDPDIKQKQANLLSGQSHLANDGPIITHTIHVMFPESMLVSYDYQFYPWRMIDFPLQTWDPAIPDSSGMSLLTFPPYIYYYYVFYIYIRPK